MKKVMQPMKPELRATASLRPVRLDFPGLCLLMLLLTGCAGQQLAANPVVADNSQFTVVRVAATDSYASLAQKYYGDATLAERISRLNPALFPASGEWVVLPKQPINRSGVYPDGYRTIPILCYHRFSQSSDTSDAMNLPISRFREQMRFLQSNGYQVIPLYQLSSYLRGEQDIPAKSVVLTADDGYRSFYELAYPVLKEFNYPLTLFVYTDFVGAPMASNWQQLREMESSGLVQIQSHSKSHASLAIAPDDETDLDALIKQEISYPNKVLEKKLGHPVTLFSYPYGDSSDQAIAQLNRSGISMAVTVQQGGNPSFANPYLLRRTMVYADDDMNEFKRKLATFRPEKLQ